MIHAFTTTNTSIVNQLRNAVIVKPNKTGGVYGERIAVWDTGAMKTTVSSRIVSDFGLRAVKYAPVSTPNGKSIAACYYVDILLPNSLTVADVLVVEGTLDNFDVLIGMDIISMGDFAVSNYNGKTVFSFRIPSVASIDFVNNP